MPEPGLAELQAWLQGRVTAGSWDVEAGAPAGWKARDVVAGSKPLPAEARVAIYARSYVGRLAECLRAEFPVLRAMIGEQVFNLFAGGYLSARPPSSYSLYDLGSGFADYLQATRPGGGQAAGGIGALPANLARLERAISEAGRAAGLETRPSVPFDAATVVLQPGARLTRPPTVRLLRLDFDFTEALAGVRAGERPAPPPPQESFVAVARTRYVVAEHRLDPWAFAWLQALAETGGDVQQAAVTAARQSGREVAQILAALMVWLPGAAEAGLVAP